MDRVSTTDPALSYQRESSPEHCGVKVVQPAGVSHESCLCDRTCPVDSPQAMEDDLLHQFHACVEFQPRVSQYLTARRPQRMFAAEGIEEYRRIKQNRYPRRRR